MRGFSWLVLTPGPRFSHYQSNEKRIRLRAVSAKLTKKFLMGLPDGAFLMSNVANYSPFFSIYSAKISPLNGREAQWKKILGVGANGRLCRVWLSGKKKPPPFNRR
jgi:hypothetical protein